YEQPCTRYVADFVGENNVFRGAVAAVDGDAIEVSVGERMTIAARPQAAAARGRVVEVRVRPEKVVVTRAKPAQNENVFAGTVREAVFQGPNIRYLVTLGDGTEAFA